jgi:hypothetical protein
MVGLLRRGLLPPPLPEVATGEGTRHGNFGSSTLLTADERILSYAASAAVNARR